jgi:hypothetical protein
MKSYFKLSQIIFVGIIMFQLSGLAQEKSFAQKGVVELGGSVSFSSRTAVYNGSTNGDAFTTLSIQPYLGYFVTDKFELGLNPLGLTYMSQGSSNATQIGIFLAPSYNFITTSGKLFPFIEGLIGYSSQTSTGSTDRSGLSYGGRTGIKVPVGGSGLLNISVQYLMITLNRSGSTSRNGENDLAIAAGFTVWM